MKCSKCGTEFESRFCPNCGTPAFDLPTSASEDTPAEQTNKTKLITKKNKWLVLGAAVLFLIVVIVLIVVLLQSCSEKSRSSGELSAADTTVQSEEAAPAVTSRATTTTTTISSSVIGANSSQTASQSASQTSSTASQSTLGSVFNSILGTSSQTSSNEYAEPDTDSGNSISSQLKDGMTYQQVEKIIGSEGTQESSVGNTVIYVWDGKGTNGSKLSLTFKDGKLNRETSIGLD